MHAATRIVDIRETAAPVASAMRDAYVDFSQMTCSVLAVTAKHHGRRVTGFGYTSNGRYAQSGLLRERFIPRLLAAGTDVFADESSEGLDPRKVRGVLMQNEKPGGHGERSVAVGGLEMAFWDLAARIAGQPGHRCMAARYGYPVPGDRVGVASPAMRIEGGTMALPDVPGLGLELRPDLAAIIRGL